MRSLLSIAFLLTAGSAGYAQSFSFDVGGRPARVDIRGYCAECISIVVPGYIEYNKPHYYDYEVPYVGRRPARQPRAAQPARRKPDVAVARDAPPPADTTSNAPAGRQAPNALPAMVPARTDAAAPAAPLPTARPSAAAAPSAPPASAASPALPPAIVAVPAVPTSPPPEPSAPSAASTAAAQTAAPAAEPAPQEVASALPAPEPPAPAATPRAAVAAPTTPSPPAPQAAEKKPAVIAALPPAKHDAEQRPRPSGNSPFGVWSSSDGQMRVEPCGRNICSYAVGGQHAGKMILRNMRPAGDNRWTGHVTDVRSGQTYSASMSMRGPNALNLQGCALGGLVCGGQTFTRAR